MDTLNWDDMEAHDKLEYINAGRLSARIVRLKWRQLSQRTRRTLSILAARQYLEITA